MAENNEGQGLLESFGIERPATETATQETTGGEAQGQNEGVTEGATEGTTEGATTQAETQPSSFFETMNKTLSTSFKSDDEVTSAWKEFNELKEKSSSWANYEAEKQTFESKIAELEQSVDPLSYFSSPEAYIAEQLRRAHPDKNPMLIQEIVTSDLSKMSNLDVLAKEVLLDNPNLEGGEQGAKEYLYDKYGIDPEEKPEDWSATLKNKILIDANRARKGLGSLKEGIEMPKVLTPEEREAAKAEARVAKEKALAPMLDKFKQFDKWTTGEGENVFEFDVPQEYKDSLEGMFKGFFLDGGLPVNEDTLQSVMELREAMFLKANFPKIKEVIENNAITKARAKTDEMLANGQPPNTTTNPHTGEGENLPGQSLRSFFGGK